MSSKASELEVWGVWMPRGLGPGPIVTEFLGSTSLGCSWTEGIDWFIHPVICCPSATVAHSLAASPVLWRY